MGQAGKARVVIVGAGFAGLWAARELADAPVEVTLVDRNNYHTFQALLYQVATAALEPESIAFPIRTTLGASPNVRFVMAHAIRVDTGSKVLVTSGPDIPYDYLILATGSVPATFGIPGIEEHSFVLKTLEEGVALRNHIICAFEKAAFEHDQEERKKLLTFVVAGGGATGVEFAGAMCELVRGSLREDFPTIDFGEVRVVLVEAGNELVAPMPPGVRGYTLKRLRSMGLEIHLNAAVTEVTHDDIRFRDGTTIATRTVVWTAGVRAEPLAEASGIPAARDGRVEVLPTMQVSGAPEIYVAGDLARIFEKDKLLPMVAQVAIQSAQAAAQNVKRALDGRAPEPFAYRDLGSMVVIGRNAAGAEIGGRTYTGFFAWILWLGVHLARLIGYRNRLVVLINWAWDYVFYERALRFIFPTMTAKTKGEAATGKKLC